jgi:hypothetical protein
MKGPEILDQADPPPRGGWGLHLLGCGRRVDTIGLGLFWALVNRYSGLPRAP